MRPERAIIAIAVLLGLSIGLIDAVLDYAWFYEGTFLELLVTNVPTHEVYIRSVIMASFVVFGVVASRLLARRRRVESALRESEQTCRLIAEQTRDVIFRTSIPDATYEYVSPSAIDLFGYASEEFYRDPQLLLQILPPGWHQYFRDKWEEIRSGNLAPFYEFPILHGETGRLRWMYQRNAWIRDDSGKLIALQGNVTDITERKEAEEQLKASENKFRKMFDESPFGIELLDSDGTVIEMNNSLLEIFGLLDPEQLIGKFNLLDDPNVPNKVKEKMRRGEDAYFESLFDFDVSRERRLFDTTRSGTIAISYSIVPSFDRENRRIKNYLVQVTDITERARAEEATRQAQEMLLDQQLHETERVETELAKVRDELIRTTRLAAIGQVAASIAHDLRNPLGAAGNACYFLKRYGSGEEAQLQEYLDIIHQELGTAHSVIDSLLSMARAEQPAKQGVDFGDLANEVFRGIQTNDNVTCRITLAPEPFVVKVDPNQMRQVVINLVRNAIQAMGDQGELLVEATRAPDADTIVFRDTGPGVAPGVLDKLFEPLITTKAKGTGLGLTICRQIIERHGGTIEAANHDEGGAVFTIHLPRE